MLVMISYGEYSDYGVSKLVELTDQQYDKFKSRRDFLLGEEEAAKLQMRKMRGVIPFEPEREPELKLAEDRLNAARELRSELWEELRKLPQVDYNELWIG